MKALAGKEQTDIDLSIKKYISAQLNTEEKEKNMKEKIKALIALSKLQKKSGSNEYNQTINEINTLKSTLG